MSESNRIDVPRAHPSKKGPEAIYVRWNAPRKAPISGVVIPGSFVVALTSGPRPEPISRERIVKLFGPKAPDELEAVPNVWIRIPLRQRG